MTPERRKQIEDALNTAREKATDMFNKAVEGVQRYMEPEASYPVQKAPRPPRPKRGPRHYEL